MAAVSEPPKGRTLDLPDSAYVDMSRVLRAGLILSLIILFAALVAYLLANPSESFSQVVSSNPALQYLGLVSLASALAHGVPDAYLTVGVLVLVATPILRVITGLYFFERNGERTITMIALIVAILLVLGLLVVGPLVH